MFQSQLREYRFQKIFIELNRNVHCRRSIRNHVDMLAHVAIQRKIFEGSLIQFKAVLYFVQSGSRCTVRIVWMRFHGIARIKINSPECFCVLFQDFQVCYQGNLKMRELLSFRRIAIRIMRVSDKITFVFFPRQKIRRYSESFCDFLVRLSLFLPRLQRNFFILIFKTSLVKVKRHLPSFDYGFQQLRYYRQNFSVRFATNALPYFNLLIYNGIAEHVAGCAD